MTYQNVLPFDENYAWTNLIKQVSKLSQGQKIVYYGLKGRKVSIQKVWKDRFKVTSYSLGALKYNIEHEKDLSFVEVEFMSTVLKPVDKHIHSYVKGLTANKDWKKQTYKCSNPDCNHYTRAELIIGKRIHCAKCGEFTFGDYDQIRHRNRKLICVNCSKSPKKEVVTAMQGELAKLFASEETEDDESRTKN